MNIVAVMATATQTQSQPNWQFPATTNNIQSAPSVRSGQSPAITQKPITPIKSPTPTNKFNLEHSTFSQVRKKLEESRKLFLRQQNTGGDEEEDRLCEEKSIIEVKPTKNDVQSKKEVLTRLSSASSNQNTDDVNPRRPTKKISFKIRKNASIYRRKAPEPKLNLVQELTKKYNELDEQRGTTTTEKARVIKRNSQNLKRRPSAKETQKKIDTKAKESNNSVKAAIAIFEQKCTLKSPKSESTPSGGVSDGVKPQVAAKTFDAKAIAMRNQEKRMRLQKKLNNGGNTCGTIDGDRIVEMPRCNSAIVTDLRNDNNNRRGNVDDASPSVVSSIASGNRDTSAPTDDHKMDACDVTDELQVVSLPMATLKRCESNYECQKFARYQQTRLSSSKLSELIDTTVNKVDYECKTTDGVSIYTLDVKKVENDTLDDDYEFVVPPEDDSNNITLNNDDKKVESEEVPPLPPRTNKISQIYTTLATPTPPVDQIINNTTDDDYEIPEVPPETPQEDSHEENIYESLSRCSRQSSDRFRSRKSSAGLSRNQHEPLPPRPPSSASSTPSIEYENDESNYYESIYSKRDDNYESIYGGSRLECDKKRNSISVHSVQSDQQSNSIYGRSITSWAEEVLDTYIGGGSCASFSGSSQNGGSVKAVSELSGCSDDWVDISDHECDDDARKNKFVM